MQLWEKPTAALGDKRGSKSCPPHDASDGRCGLRIMRGSRYITCLRKRTQHCSIATLLRDLTLTKPHGIKIKSQTYKLRTGNAAFVVGAARSLACGCACLGNQHKFGSRACVVAACWCWSRARICKRRREQRATTTMWKRCHTFGKQKTG